jgi:hypothetical protein
MAALTSRCSAPVQDHLPACADPVMIGVIVTWGRRCWGSAQWAAWSPGRALRHPLGSGQVGFVVIRCDQQCWGIAERDVIGQPLRRHVTVRRGDRQLADGAAQLDGQSTNLWIRWEQSRSGKSEGDSPGHVTRSVGRQLGLRRRVW